MINWVKCSYFGKRASRKARYDYDMEISFDLDYGLQEIYKKGMIV